MQLSPAQRAHVRTIVSRVARAYGASATLLTGGLGFAAWYLQFCDRLPGDVLLFRVIIAGLWLGLMLLLAYEAVGDITAAQKGARSQVRDDIIHALTTR
jgi:hypothetical protein